MRRELYKLEIPNPYSGILWVNSRPNLGFNLFMSLEPDIRNKVIAYQMPVIIQLSNVRSELKRYMDLIVQA